MHTLCQEIEYYPSQAEINIKSFNRKRLNKQENGSAHKRISIEFFEGEKTNNNTTLSWSNRELKRKWKGFISSAGKIATKRSVDPVFHGHPKTREELWNDRFLEVHTKFDQTPSLVKLLHNITLTYLSDCTSIILYDKHVQYKEYNLLQDLLKIYPAAYVHGSINDEDHLDEPKIAVPLDKCVHFIVFLEDVKICEKVIGLQATNKVVIVARSSQWAVQEFLEGKFSRKFVNLLVIAMSFNDEGNNLESPYILYTHKLYTDGLGGSRPVVLTSWARGRYTRDVHLFPAKMRHGYAGHRLVVAAANQPPFVVRRIHSDSDGGNPKVIWDGIEIRVLRILAERNNFSIEIIEPQEPHLGSGDAVAKEISSGRADVGVAGMYLSKDRALQMDMSFPHSQDCAAFITLMSTALPRYRAILGPFHWHVWLALTLTYLFGIIPLAFSDKHTLRHLIENKGEIENMFWYVFGTFTNCFTFVGKNSWSKTTKITTRLLIGWYWIFTIIITSCYTGCIIAFVTLPIYPETIDTIDQLLKGFYRTGTLDRGGWERWFFNSSDQQAERLLKKMELLPDVEAGIKNITKAFFWPYAFLGSKAELQYIVQANFSVVNSKRAVLHIADECFVPFSVAMAFPNQSLYMNKLSSDIGRMFQNGLLQKIVDEVRWNLQRTSTGRLLEVEPAKWKFTSAEEKGLTLEDTQGMFLLLGAGFLLGASSLISEWMGGCTRKCRLRKKNEHVATSNSERNLIGSPDSNRISSSQSRDTLEGTIIVLNRENILIHNEFNEANWDSRRSSSIDIDREVREIFERDLRNRVHPIGENDRREDNRSTSSKIFGGRIRSP